MEKRYKYTLLYPGRKPRSISLLAVIALTLLLVTCAILLCTKSDSDHFTAFMVKYNKSYADPTELLYRKRVFEDNLKRIEEFNNNSSKTIKVAINQFGDLTDEEFRSIYLHPIHESFSTYSLHNSRNRTQEIDWEKMGYFPPVKDQGNCGSCWAFGAIGSVEALYAIKNRKSIKPFAEQELVDCANKDYGSLGCNGGDSCGAFRYIFENGISLEIDYKYHAETSICRNTTMPKKKLLKEGCVRIEPGKPLEILDALQEHPITVSVEADNFVFRFYRKGLITEGCGSSVDHSVVLVGTGVWDPASGKKFWRIRNSWGPNWGMDGYAYIERDDTEGKVGVCGVALFPSYPL